MITAGLVTVMVSDMDRAVRFYTEVLGLKLTQRFGNHWASIQSPGGLVIGLHPASEQSPAGREGSITIGFQVEGPIEQVVERLKQQGVNFRGPIVDDDPVRIANFGDPDGNELYLAEVRADYQKYKPGATAA